MHRGLVLALANTLNLTLLHDLQAHPAVDSSHSFHRLPGSLLIPELLALIYHYEQSIICRQIIE